MAKAYREVLVGPANSWRETVWVLVVAGLIVFAGAGRVLLLPGEEKSLSLQPYQHLDTTLTDAQRSIYQALLSSQNEVVMLWQAEHRWPTVETLAEEGIPPFATDLMPAAFKDYRWVGYDRGPWVDYLGSVKNAADSMSSVILRIIDLHADFHPHPHPGRDYDPGQKSAVQIWLQPERGQRYPGMRLAERGWFWILPPDSPILTKSGEPTKSVAN